MTADTKQPPAPAPAAEQAPPPPTGEQPKGAGKWLKLVIALAAVVSFLVVVRLLPLAQWMESFSGWVKDLGLLGQAIYILLYILCTVLWIPGTLLSVLAGAVYRVVVGTVIISVGSTLGAAAAFLIGRYFVRARVESWVAGSPKFAAIDRAVGQQGWKIVLLTRLSPIFPFNLLNYAFGLTRVGFWSYLLASWIGMLPGTVLFVYVGQFVGDVTQISSGGWTEALGEIGGSWPTFIGLAATIAVSVYVGAVARRALKQAAGESVEA